jgi:signal transduction histidine kinase/DNA-binding NarL/FixJ family response regulator
VLGGDAPASTQWRALIRDLTAAGRAQVLPAAGAVLRLPFSREALSFTLAAPKYGAGGEVRFSTRLLGYSDQWSAPAANPEAVFTNLIGGPFTLEVRAHDAEGNVSAPATCTFAIVPPWHRTTGAYTFYVFVGLGAIGVFVRWRLGRAQREQRRLVGLVATRTVELAAARDQAEAASRAKSAFLAAMSHELRTPLNGVIGYAQILQSDARLAPDQRERVRIVQQSGEHLLHMINDVLDLAKIEAGKIEIRPAPFALGELLRDIAASHAPAAANKRLAFVLDAAADLPELVDGDAQRIRQVLDNLVGNAIKFTPQGRVTLRVEAAVAAGIAEIRFSVIDTGPGITAADQARLFHPFERAAATPADAPGTGLGLAISRALVESMGGALALQSEEKVGSTFAFSLRLPLAAQLADTSAAAPRLLGYEGPRRRVLVVDDHALNRRLFLDLLTQLGFECAERAAGAEAFRCLAAAAPESWPDLVICDVRMAGVDGLALTRALRASPHGRAVKILLTSASVLTFDREAGREAGADDFLPKPFQAAELHAKVGQLLALRWREAPPADCHPLDDKAAETAPVPPVVRATLHELLAQGDLEAFRAALARARAEHPASAAHWDELDAAAASFQLSRLRQLLG